MQDCIHLWVLGSGWLTFDLICITQGFEVKIELATIVNDSVLATWVSAKLGCFDECAYCG